MANPEQPFKENHWLRKVGGKVTPRVLPRKCYGVQIGNVHVHCWRIIPWLVSIVSTYGDRKSSISRSWWDPWPFLLRFDKMGGDPNLLKWDDLILQGRPPLKYTVPFNPENPIWSSKMGFSKNEAFKKITHASTDHRGSWKPLLEGPTGDSYRECIKLQPAITAWSTCSEKAVSRRSVVPGGPQQK